MEQLEEQFPLLVRKAIDFVLDPIHTCRTKMSDLDNVEKTFVGLKVEHFVRELLDVPKGLRDLELAGLDVDIKNTTQGNWMIPPETYRNQEPVLVISSEESSHHCWLGLIIARPEYLRAPNRDQKCAIKSAAFRNILWLVNAEPYPVSRWARLDMSSFHERRKVRGGSQRAYLFFRDNLRVPVHRGAIQALLSDQDDYMKRLRENGGARDLLKKEGITLLSGNYDTELIEKLGLPDTRRDEMIAVKLVTGKDKGLSRHKDADD